MGAGHDLGLGLLVLAAGAGGAARRGLLGGGSRRGRLLGGGGRGLLGGGLLRLGGGGAAPRLGGRGLLGSGLLSGAGSSARLRRLLGRQPRRRPALLGGGCSSPRAAGLLRRSFGARRPRPSVSSGCGSLPSGHQALYLHRGGLLCLMRMLRARVDFSLRSCCATKPVARQHPLTASLRTSSGRRSIISSKVRERRSAREAAVAVVALLLALVARHRHLLGVDDDHEVADVAVRRVLRLALATERVGDLGREPAERLARWRRRRASCARGLLEWLRRSSWSSCGAHEVSGHRALGRVHLPARVPGRVRGTLITVSDGRLASPGCYPVILISGLGRRLL